MQSIQYIKPVVDLGIVVVDADRSLAFYRDTLGLDYLGEVALDAGRMWLLTSGDTMVKLMQFDEPRQAANPPGGITGATGFRWCTMWTHDLEAVVERCTAGGYRIAQPITERGTRRFTIVEDPDGNSVEFFDPGTD